MGRVSASVTILLNGAIVASSTKGSSSILSFSADSGILELPFIMVLFEDWLVLVSRPYDWCRTVFPDKSVSVDVEGGSCRLDSELRVSTGAPGIESSFRCIASI